MSVYAKLLIVKNGLDCTDDIDPDISFLLDDAMCRTSHLDDDIRCVIDELKSWINSNEEPPLDILNECIKDLEIITKKLY